MEVKGLFLLLIGINGILANDLNRNGIWVPWDGSYTGIPQNAVIGGADSAGNYLYVIRADHYQDGTYRGKVTGKFTPSRWHAYIPYYNKEHTKRTFDVLTHTNYIWVYGGNNYLIPGGITGSGAQQYICRVFYRGNWIPGKLGNGKCYICWNGDEIEFSSGDWQILRRANNNL